MAHRVLERVHHVVLVHELVARVEAEDHRHGGQPEQLDMGGPHVGTQHVGEAHHRDRHVGAALGEVVQRSLGLHHVALDRCARRMRSPHALVEEGGIVLLAPVEVGGGLEHHLANGRIRAAARGEDVHRPDHVVLVRLGGTRGGGVDHQPRIHDGVDFGRIHHPAQQGVLSPHLHVLGALELHLRLEVAHPDDDLHLVEALERLGQAAAPVGGDAGDQHPARILAGSGHPNQTDLRVASMSQRPSWMRARTSWATVCTSALSSCIPGSSKRIGSRKRSLNLAGR